jgi:hypothetical protein
MTIVGPNPKIPITPAASTEPCEIFRAGGKAATSHGHLKTKKPRPGNPPRRRAPQERLTVVNARIAKYQADLVCAQGRRVKILQNIAVLDAKEASRKRRSAPSASHGGGVKRQRRKHASTHASGTPTLVSSPTVTPPTVSPPTVSPTTVAIGKLPCKRRAAGGSEGNAVSHFSLTHSVFTSHHC